MTFCYLAQQLSGRNWVERLLRITLVMKLADGMQFENTREGRKEGRERPKGREYGGREGKKKGKGGREIHREEWTEERRKKEMEGGNEGGVIDMEEGSKGEKER